MRRTVNFKVSQPNGVCVATFPVVIEGSSLSEINQEAKLRAAKSNQLVEEAVRKGEAFSTKTEAIELTN